MYEIQQDVAEKAEVGDSAVQSAMEQAWEDSRGVRGGRVGGEDVAEKAEVGGSVVQSAMEQTWRGTVELQQCYLKYLQKLIFRETNSSEDQPHFEPIKQT